jgi:hypothetical protein
MQEIKLIINIIVLMENWELLFIQSSSFNQLVSPILSFLTSIIHYDIAEHEVKIIVSTSCITAVIFSIGIFTLIFLLQRSKNNLRDIIKSKC